MVDEGTRFLTHESQTEQYYDFYFVFFVYMGFVLWKS